MEKFRQSMQSIEDLKTDKKPKNAKLKFDKVFPLQDLTQNNSRKVSEKLTDRSEQKSKRRGYSSMSRPKTSKNLLDRQVHQILN